MNTPYENRKIRGPHGGSSRSTVQIYLDDGTFITTQYSRYLMEVHLGRYLGENEVVHHIDGNYCNNSIDNLQVLTREEHNKLHKTKPPESFICPWCSIKFELEGSRLYTYRWNSKTKPGYRGPFCCDYHARKYSRNREHGNI